MTEEENGFEERGFPRYFVKNSFLIAMKKQLLGRKVSCELLWKAVNEPRGLLCVSLSCTAMCIRIVECIGEVLN